MKKAALLIAISTALTPATLAGLPNPIEVHERVHELIHRKVARDIRRLASVPRIILSEHRRAFDPYASGRVWYAPHRHHHDIYRFPVSFGGRVSYRREAYCSDRLFVDIDVRLPRLAADIYVPYVVNRGVSYHDRRDRCHRSRRSRCDDDCD